MVEDREPDPSEPRLATPAWALDAAAEQGGSSVAMIKQLGVNVFGDVDALATRVPESKDTPLPPSDIPVDAAVEAVVAVIEASRQEPTSRELAGRLWRQTRKDGVRSLLRKSDA